jgi:polyisoprenoid-binding protein YceI
MFVDGIVSRESKKLPLQMKASIKVSAVVLACFALSQLATAQENAIELDPAKTQVAFTLADVLHTVHGTFRLQSGVIHFDPSSGAAGGDVIIDATSGNSGSGARDKKMRHDILESQRYPTIEFLPKQVIGRVASQGASQVQVRGTFRLHGSDHDLTLTFPVQIHGSLLLAATNFEVPYEAWGLKNPSTLFLRVSNKVQIEITATGTLQATNAATASH